MDLLYIMGQARDDHILEANRKRTRHGHFELSRTALIAAILAVLLLLAGCVAVLMKLEDRKIGEFTHTYKFDDYGNAITPTVKAYDVMTLSGKLGSPNQMATQEWYEFTQSYNPQKLLLVDDPDLPEVYKYNYSCHTQDMVDALDAIVEKHGIKLLGTRKVTQREQAQDALNCLGIDGFTLPDARAEVEYGVCWLFPPYTFDFDLTLTLEDETVWGDSVWAEYYYLHKDYLYPNNLLSYNLETCQQWEYVTADGTKVLLVMDNRRGTILAEKDKVDIAIHLDFVTDTFLHEDTVLPTRATLEAFADLFDYNIEPQKIDVTIIPPEEAPAYEPELYAGYSDYVNTYYAQPQYYQYAFYDVDGNGTEDLLVGYQYDNDFFTDCCTMVDGNAQRLIWGPARVCQGGVLESDNSDPSFEEYHGYFRVKKLPSPNEPNAEHIANISCRDEVWYQDQTVISQEQAEEVIAKYPPVELEWYPLTSFPMDESGTTFGDVIAAERTMTEEELKHFYAQQDYSESYYEPLQYFCLRDMNGDGITDLLLSVDGERVNASYTVLRGELCYLETDFYLYNGGWEAVSYTEDLQIGKVESHFFYYQEHGKTKMREALNHFLSTDTWKTIDYQPMTKAEAEAIFAKYPRLDLPFRPISELQ